MNDLAIQEVTRYVAYLEDTFTDPLIDEPMFEIVSYSKWAACEILNRLMDRPFDTPDTVLDEFIYDMTMRSYDSSGMNKNRIFAIAVDVAEEILQLL